LGRRPAADVGRDDDNDDEPAPAPTAMEALGAPATSRCGPRAETAPDSEATVCERPGRLAESVVGAVVGRAPAACCIAIGSMVAVAGPLPLPPYVAVVWVCVTTCAECVVGMAPSAGEACTAPLKPIVEPPYPTKAQCEGGAAV
jgi:hypothetical protein